MIIVLVVQIVLWEVQPPAINTEAHTISQQQWLDELQVQFNEELRPPRSRIDNPQTQRAFSFNDNFDDLFNYEDTSDDGDAGTYLNVPSWIS